MKNKMVIVSIYIMMLFPTMSLALGLFMLLVSNNHVFFNLSISIVSLLLIMGLFKGVEHFESE